MCVFLGEHHLRAADWMTSIHTPNDHHFSSSFSRGPGARITFYEIQKFEPNHLSMKDTEQRT
jgi:hypothetical protein